MTHITLTALLALAWLTPPAHKHWYYRPCNLIVQRCMIG